MPVRTFMTAEQFDALPEEEERKWELLDGELIEVPSATPEHNLILGRIHALIYSFARPRRLGMPLLETDMAVRRDSRLRPDLGFLSADTMRTIQVKKVPVQHPPDIAVEIIAPSETASTINRKVKAYLAWGVQEVWLIYPETGTLCLHVHNGAQTLSEGAFLMSDLIPGWRIQVSEIFDDL